MRLGSWARSFTSCTVVIGLSLMVFACGGPPGPEVATVDAPASGSSADVTKAESEPRPDPVEAPDNVVALGTLRTPGELLDLAFTWGKADTDYRSLLETTPLAAFLPVVDFEAPVDAIVTVDPKAQTRPRFFGALSIGLTSRQAALDAFRQLERPVEFVEPGVHLVKPTPKLACFVSTALGQAPARLTCAGDRESLDLLSPYLTRGNPSSQTGDADLHVELRAEAAHRVFGSKAAFLKAAVPVLMAEVSVGDPAFDTALEEAAHALADEIIAYLADLSSLTLEARSSRERGALDVSLELSMRGASSWISQSVADSASRQALPPEAFWRLPADASSATYSSPVNPERLRGMVDVLSRISEAGLAYLGAAPKSRKAISALISESLKIKGPSVSARGELPPPSSPQGDPAAKLEATLGYTLFGLAVPASEMRSVLDGLVDAYDDKSLRGTLGKKLDVDLSSAPAVTRKPGPKALPASRVYQVQVPLDGDAEESSASSKPKPVPVYLLLTGDSQYSWLGLSTRLDVLEEKLAAVLDPKAAERGLGSRADLGQLREEPAVAGGLWSLQTLLSSPEVRQALGDPASFAAGPPITWRSHAEPTGPKARGQVRVPREIFETLGEIARRLK